MLPTDENMKVCSERIARALTSATTLPQADRVFSEAGVLASNKPGRNGSVASAGPHLRSIGIWEPRRENGRTIYVRKADPASSALWANAERIGPKEGRKRFLLLGESVARGIFYEPFFSPALALEKILSSTIGDEVDVVDLARSDIGIYDLALLTECALDLDPDGIVIFAGNNWRLPRGSSAFDLSQTAQEVRDSGDWELVTARAYQEINSSIALLLRRLRSVAMDKNIPVVFLLPEFNLGDWQNEYCGQVPFMSGSELLAWETWRNEAEENLAAGNIIEAEALATRMIAVDMGIVPVGYELLARCRLSVGDSPAARAFLELARDASQLLPIHHSPRCYGTIQQTLRREVVRHGMRLVDLPRLFARRSDDAIPGCDLFLDYCHMTSSGIRFAMAAAVKELLPCLIAGPECARPDPFSVPIQVEPAAEAHAHFLAAIHNARCGQGYKIIRHHCETALKYDPLMAETMRLYLKAHLEPVPLLMSKYFWEMRPDSRMALTAQPLARSMKREREIAWTLVDALVDLLSTVFPNIRDEVDLTLQREFAISGKRSINLLVKPFCNPAARHLERDWEQRTTHFTAYSQRSVFWFPASGNFDVQISLACRVPAASASSDPVRIFIDGRLIHAAPASARWQQSQFSIPPEMITTGFAKIMIEWPRPGWTKEERIDGIAQSIERGPISGARAGFPEIFAVFGEVQSFTAVCTSSLCNPKQATANFHPAGMVHQQ